MNRRDAIKRTTFLLGAGLSVGTLSGIMAGCQPEQKTADLDWIPQFLDNNQANLIAEIAERIVPQTDTPGAKDVGVPQFIETLIAEYYQKDDQDKIVKGLVEVDKKAQELYQKDFVTLSAEEMDKVLIVFDVEAKKQAKKIGKEMEKEGLKDKNRFNTLPYDVNKKWRNRDVHFFRMIKEMTWSGYFLSEVGATEVLQYSHIPGEYVGCVPLEEVGVAYSVG